MSSRKRKDFVDVDNLSDKEFDAILAKENAKNVVVDEKVEISNSNTQTYQLFFACSTIAPIIFLYTSSMFGLSLHTDYAIIGITAIAAVFALYIAYSELTDNVINDERAKSDKMTKSKGADHQLEACYQSIFRVNIAFIIFFCVLAFRLVPAFPMGDMPQINMAVSVLIPAAALATFVRSNE